MGKSVAQVKIEQDTVSIKTEPMSDSESSEEEEDQDQDSSSDQDIKQEQDSSEDEEVTIKQEEESSEEEEKEEEEEEDTETSNKRKRSEDDEGLKQEEQPKKIVKVEEVVKKQFGAQGATVWVGQISYDAKAEDIRQHFSQCGQVVDVRLRTDRDTGRSKGFAHIDFADASGKSAAMKLDGTEFMGRTIKVDNATPATLRTQDNNFGPKTDTVFMANLAHSLDEDAIRQVFEKFGTIVGEIRLPINHDTGKIRGIGYVQYETADQAEAAVKGMNGVSVEGRPLRTDFSGGDDSDRVRSRPAHAGFRGGRGGQRGGRGRGNSFSRGRGGFRGNDRGRGNNRGRGGRSF